MKMVLFLFLICTYTVFAESADQTDWSGGSVEPGPVSSWSDEFSSSEAVEFTETPGSILLLWGKLTNSSTAIQNSSLYAVGAYPGDVDMDGDIDVLAASSVDNLVLWWENVDGSATSWQSHLITNDLSGAWGVVCADIDNDNDQDLFVSAMGAGVVLWFENTDGIGTSWIEHQIDGSFDGAKAIIAIDMDEDGSIDVAAAAKTDNQVVWYRNEGSGTSWTKNIIVDDYSGANSVYACDFDTDGDWDILSVAKSAKAVRWYENSNGAGTEWTEHSIGEDFTNARTAEACDIDGDGDADVIAAGGISKASGEICWWENTDGAATLWTQHSIDDDFQGPYTVLHCDMDQDGDPDVVAGSLTENAICWWENNGTGSSWVEQKLCDYFAPRTVSSADLNGDGNQEIFAGSLYSLEITWWNTFGHLPEGSLVSSILDTGEDSEWNTLEWTSDTPSGTSVGISMRSSWDETDLGEWSDTVYSSPADLSSMINDTDRFVQYSVVMQSESPEVTPVLEHIQISWNPLSIGGDDIHNFELTVAQGNPSGHNLTIRCILPETQTAQLTLYDLSGRAIYATGNVTMDKGQNDFNVQEIPDGLYFARLNLENNSISTRVTVLH